MQGGNGRRSGEFTSPNGGLPARPGEVKPPLHRLQIAATRHTVLLWANFFVARKDFCPQSFSLHPLEFGILNFELRLCRAVLLAAKALLRQ